jgi:hypothetical protein
MTGRWRMWTLSLNCHFVRPSRCLCQSRRALFGAPWSHGWRSFLGSRHSALRELKSLAEQMGERVFVLRVGKREPRLGDHVRDEP